MNLTLKRMFPRMLAALLLVGGLAARALGQTPGLDKPSPPRDIAVDSVRTMSAPPEAAPQRLDLTPPAPGPSDRAPKPVPSSFRNKAWLGDQHLDVWGRYNRVEG
ncbi:MAG TPA: hypothetical protein VFP10_13075, partial [Candidatus Eisenbacteria bacterium]|nr:hypothetical protein [Candidatus Eisenbacteria bacterium]